MAKKKGFSPLKSVTSQAINRISHHADDEVLLVQYSSGDDWYYENVPRHVYQEILDCEKNDKASVGKVFLNLVKNNPNRPGRKVNG